MPNFNSCFLEIMKAHYSVCGAHYVIYCYNSACMDIKAILLLFFAFYLSPGL